MLQYGYVTADDGDSNASSEITGTGTAGQVAVFASAQVIGNPTVPFTSGATGFAIGNTTTYTSAIMAWNSTEQGILPPRMTTAQRNAIVSPEQGLLLYNSSQGTLSVYGLTAGSPAWASVITTATMPANFAPGDLLYASSTSALSRLAVSATDGVYLRNRAGATPVWSTVSFTDSATTGDLMYASAANTWNNLAAVAAGSYLRSAGASTAPVWSTLILPNSATANQIVYATSTNTYGGSANLTYDGTSIIFVSDTSTLRIRSLVAATSLPALYFGVTPNSTNHTLTADASTTTLNAGVLVTLRVASVAYLTLATTALTFTESVNCVFGTTTGSKLGTATTQKLSFWNATPIVQPANTVAIDTLLVNTGLRASGGTANFATNIVATARMLKNQGADIASATNLTLGADGNVFEITGTTTIDLILITNWQNGAVVTLVFNESLTVRHGIATSGSNVTILLAGAANFSATANDTLTLMLCETTAGGQAWREIARAAI